MCSFDLCQFRAVNEFDLIDNIKSRFSLDLVGDDCAVVSQPLDEDLLVTTDMLVEDVDFRLEWAPPRSIGHKALAVSLSDVAAMGGRPRYGLISIGLPEKCRSTTFLTELYDGWHDLAGKHGLVLAGGDTSGTPDRLVIDSTVLGSTARGSAILRSGARSGDQIFVTGFLGGAAAGLALLEKGIGTTDKLNAAERHLLLRQLEPLPQVTTAILLQEHSLAVSMIDISDGLSSDLNHILRSSSVGAEIDGGAIPVDPAIGLAGFDEGAALDLALNGGEDLELLFTVRPENADAALDLGFHRIGEINDHSGEASLFLGGQKIRLQPRGFTHF